MSGFRDRLNDILARLRQTFGGAEPAPGPRAGYDPGFLRRSVPLPAPSELNRGDVARLTGSSEVELRYQHFSIVMNRSRRLAMFTAVNIDGGQLREIKRERDRWQFDPRIDRNAQVGSELYDGTVFDRGHLVRRLDPVWGKAASQADEDTFHFTNCAPQHEHFNRREWHALEDYILKTADARDLRVSVFTGPVFRPDDPEHRGVRVPLEYWKIVAFRRANGTLSASAYLRTQRNLPGVRDLEFGAFRTYQVPLAEIERLSALGFGDLAGLDVLAGARSLDGPTARLIRGPDDLAL
jgi:endonuclease G